VAIDLVNQSWQGQHQAALPQGAKMGLTAGKIPKAASADHIQDGYDANTAVGTPGVDTALATEKAIRDALDLKAGSTHAANHTDGTDDIQDATAAQKGLATAAQITKLDAVEALADVTDATNVASAGAVMQSLATTKGDILAATGANALARLGVGANNQLLVADSAQAAGVKWAAPKKETWISCNTGNNNGDYASQDIAAAGVGYLSFNVPYDFAILTSAKLVLIGGATGGTENIDYDLQYAAVGEAKNTNTGSDTTTTYNVTLDQLFEIDLSSQLGSLAAGDIVGVKITNNSVNTHSLLGLRLVYTV